MSTDQSKRLSDVDVSEVKAVVGDFLDVNSEPAITEIAQITTPRKPLEEKTNRVAQIINPGSFEPEAHFYPRVLNASLHPMVKLFVNMGNSRLAQRYVHLHPGTNKEKLEQLLAYVPQHFFWAGTDLFCVTNEHAQRQLIIIETNSCPSGQKSMPCDDIDDGSGYHKLCSHTVKYLFDQRTIIPKEEGVVAVVFDKNHMEATGYAAVLADVLKEKVYQVEFYYFDESPPVRWENGVMFIRDESNNWLKVRACFRYVTQKPWNRFPVESKTLVMNSILSCIAGGRNKLVASKAYELFNLELAPYGLGIRTPDTVTDVTLAEIPLYVKSMGMCAVVKVPYSNAGQGVFTITSKEELDSFMKEKHHYDKFIVQSLVGNSKWTSMTRTGKFYHVGTVPDKKNETYVADIRMMIGGSDKGFIPIAVYARRARSPLVEELHSSADSWDMLGTNLSVKQGLEWTTETTRLLLMDNKDFNKLGIGLDDLIDAYVQSVLCCIAIDKMCKKLMTDKGFDWDLFFSLDHDDALFRELSKMNHIKK